MSSALATCRLVERDSRGLRERPLPAHMRIRAELCEGVTDAYSFVPDSAAPKASANTS